MENLQKAIEKARASRRQTKHVPQADHVATQRVPTPREASAWAALPELPVDANHLTTHRVMTQQSGPHASHYDMLRTRIRDMARKKNWRRIAIVSAGPQVGKTTTLANLAFSFGRLPYDKTMVFDFDLRRSSLHTVVGHTPTSNLGDVIEGRTPFETHARRVGENLSFILNNAHVENSAELLQSGGMSDFLTRVQNSFSPDLMLFDTPPLMAADDTRGFLSNVDAALLVVEAERTPMDQIDIAEQQLAELTNVLGVVLNKCNYPDPTSALDYGYY